MDPLEKYKDDIQQLCRKYAVSQLYAFGSVLTEDFKESSDIDLLVNFHRKIVEDYARNYYNLKFSLERIFERPVDLLEGKALKNPYLIKSIEKHWRLIFTNSIP